MSDETEHEHEHTDEHEHEHEHEHEAPGQEADVREQDVDWAFVVFSKGGQVSAFGGVTTALIRVPAVEDGQQVQRMVMLSPDSEPSGTQIRMACIEVSDEIYAQQVAQYSFMTHLQQAQAMAAQQQAEQAKSKLVVPEVQQRPAKPRRNR